MEMPDADDALPACCASPRWVAAMRARRPFAGLDAVLLAADDELARLDWSEVEKALAAHPRIGERATAPGLEAVWSRREQSAATTEDPAPLAEANAEYERRFGHVFLVHANGRTAGDILADLRARLGNDVDTERAVVRRELRGIVRSRLTRWLS